MSASAIRRRYAVLATVCLAAFAINLDTTIVNVALPDLARELGATTRQLQWIVDGYNLAFAGLVLTAGSLGDRFGRRPALLVGLGVAIGPVTAPQMPIAPARSRRSGKVFVMIDRVVGKIRAANMPMANRTAISAPLLPTTAPSPLASANPPRPTSSAGRRPNRSPSEPAVRTRPAKARL